MIPIYYINLDRVPERRTFMEGQFSAQGCTATRIPAVDAFDLTPPREYAPASWLERWSLSISEIACFESHRIAWRAIRDGSAPCGVILKDDAILSAQFSTTLERLAKITRPFDVIKLDGANQFLRFGPEIETGGIRLRTIHQCVTSAAAYLLSKEGAAKLEARASRYCDHLDDFIFTPRDDWTLLQLEPAVAVQGMFIRDEAGNRSEKIGESERTSDTRINLSADRGPVKYRLLKELRRNGRKLKWKLWADRQLRARGGLIGRPPMADDLGTYT